VFKTSVLFCSIIAILYSNPASARVDNGDGWFGGTGVLCQKKWAFDRDVAKGKLKIIGYGYRHREPEPIPGKEPNASKVLKTILKTVVIAVADIAEEDASYMDLLLIDVMQFENAPTFCYYGTVPQGPELPEASVIHNFHFYRGGKIPLEPKLEQGPKYPKAE
jgi:hypothetical protein